MTHPSRYLRQILFDGIQQDGQDRIGDCCVLVVGCGALGGVTADWLVRAGVGEVRIVDRDFVDLSNLQRQVLFTEQDVHDQLPKAVAAARRLPKVNSDVRVTSPVADVDFRSIGRLADGVDLILDGTDNFETRYLLNDYSLESGLPWIFTGCTGSLGQVMPVFPGRSGCLQCLIPEAPPPGATDTCDTAGVIGPAVGMTASFQSAVALRILSGQGDEVPPDLTIIDAWRGTVRAVDMSRLAGSEECRACAGERRYLDGSMASGTAVLCGRNAVQVSPGGKLAVSLEELAQRLESVGKVSAGPFLARVILEESGLEISVFPDGRAIIRGTEDPVVARAVYSRYIGV